MKVIADAGENTVSAGLPSTEPEIRFSKGSKHGVRQGTVRGKVSPQLMKGRES